MKTENFKGVLLFALAVVLLILFTSLVAYAQEDVFTVSPGAFTVRDVPPMGTPYTIPQIIVVWNRDNVPRTVSITAEVPPEGAATPGYEPIPNANWVIPSPASVMIPENSYAAIHISLNIPRWENLTGQKWEVWIPVERERLPGEVGTLRPTVIMKIETTEALPPGGKSTTYLTISSGENFTLRVGESKYLTAELISDGSLVQGETINWSATAGNIAPSSGQTNTLGQVTVVYTAPSTETLVIVSASYEGSEQYESSSASSYCTITALSPTPSSTVRFDIRQGAIFAYFSVECIPSDAQVQLTPGSSKTISFTANSAPGEVGFEVLGQSVSKDFDTPIGTLSIPAFPVVVAGVNVANVNVDITGRLAGTVNIAGEGSVDKQTLNWSGWGSQSLTLTVSSDAKAGENVEVTLYPVYTVDIGASVSVPILGKQTIGSITAAELSGSHPITVTALVVQPKTPIGLLPITLIGILIAGVVVIVSVVIIKRR